VSEDELKEVMATLHIEHPIYISLDFDTVEQAAAFQDFLETNVWTSQEASPALAGTPRARVLTDVDAAPAS
jgi:hypothetical protein